MNQDQIRSDVRKILHALDCDMDEDCTCTPTPPPPPPAVFHCHWCGAPLSRGTYCKGHEDVEAIWRVLYD